MIRMKIFQLLTSSFVFLFALIIQVYACELTSSNLQKWLDRNNRANRVGLYYFMKNTDVYETGGWDGINFWDINHSVSFEGLPVKFVLIDEQGDVFALTLVEQSKALTEKLASQYICDINDSHITLDWANYNSDFSHTTLHCGRSSGYSRPYIDCVNFVQSPEYDEGSHNALKGCRDLVYDFTKYSDDDVCLGYVKREDFRHEERLRGLDCDKWFAALVP